MKGAPPQKLIAKSADRGQQRRKGLAPPLRSDSQLALKSGMSIPLFLMKNSISGYSSVKVYSGQVIIVRVI